MPRQTLATKRGAPADRRGAMPRDSPHCPAALLHSQARPATTTRIMMTCCIKSKPTTKLPAPILAHPRGFLCTQVRVKPDHAQPPYLSPRARTHIHLELSSQSAMPNKNFHVWY
eukprot:jgi/Psemu1/41504/gm1.41504_g